MLTAFASFIFELSGITQRIFYFFKLKPFKPFSCGKCMSFHTGWIYFYATGQPFYLSVALGCVCGILSIYLCKYAYSGSVY